MQKSTIAGPSKHTSSELFRDRHSSGSTFKCKFGPGLDFITRTVMNVPSTAVSKHQQRVDYSLAEEQRLDKDGKVSERIHSRVAVTGGETSYQRQAFLKSVVEEVYDYSAFFC